MSSTKINKPNYIYIEIKLTEKLKNLNNDMFGFIDKFFYKKISHKDLNPFILTPPTKIDYFPIGSKRSTYREPPNNDGRDFCWWCGEETKTIQGITSQYNVCGKCGR